MLTALYRCLLRLPDFPGKARLQTWLGRRWFHPAAQRVVHGLRMELDPREWMQNDLMRTGTSEPGTVALLGRLLRPGDTFVDVGAHVGFLSLVARHHVGPAGRVLAIEPQPYNAARFLDNCRVNGFTNLELIVAAVGDRAGTVTLSDQPATDKSKLSLTDPLTPSVARFVVPLVRLDEVLAAHQVAKCTLMKIDVEGFEEDVFRGLGQAAGLVENIVVEVLKPTAEAVTKLTNLLPPRANQQLELLNVHGEPWQPGRPLPEGNLWIRWT